VVADVERVWLLLRDLLFVRDERMLVVQVGVATLIPVMLGLLLPDTVQGMVPPVLLVLVTVQLSPTFVLVGEAVGLTVS